MSKKKFNRKYAEFQPSVSAKDGPSTKRICKPVKCEDDKNTSTP